jgi:hypothetical protein
MNLMPADHAGEYPRKLGDLYGVITHPAAGTISRTRERRTRETVFK